MKDPFLTVAFFASCFICYLISLMMGYVAKDALKDGDLKACEEIFPIFLVWNFVTGALLGLTTGSLVIDKLQLQNTPSKILTMISSIILGGLLLVIVRIRWRNKLMKRFNHGS